MGQWIAKATGADVQQDIAKRQAEMQAEQTRQAAEQAARATQEAAMQANRQMELAAVRAQVEAAAAESAGKPMENADVLLDKPEVNSVTQTRKRKATFGTGYQPGVSI